MTRYQVRCRYVKREPGKNAVDVDFPCSGRHDEKTATVLAAVFNALEAQGKEHYAAPVKLEEES